MSANPKSPLRRIISSGRLWLALLVGCGFWPRSASSQSYLFTTIAGSPGNAGKIDGTNRNARFFGVTGLAVGPAGDLFVADADASIVRRITPSGPDWVVTTIAGQPGVQSYADGTNALARFALPEGVAVDSAGNVFVTDSGNHTIRKLTLMGTNWVVSTLAGSPGAAGTADGLGSVARFYGPRGVAVDGQGNLYVCDVGNHTIRLLQPVGTNWLVTTLAGAGGQSGYADGTNSAARFLSPRGLVLAGAGTIYVSDGSQRIRKLQQIGSDWVVTSIAGSAGQQGWDDGTNDTARFNYPMSIAMDRAGNLFVTDWGYDIIRKITPVGPDWVVTTIGGSPGVIGHADGIGSNAQFWDPEAIAVDAAGNLYISDYYNFTIRQGVQGAPPPDNLYPVARSKPVYILAGSDGFAQASIDDGSYDPDGDSITILQSPPGPYPIGTNYVTLTVTDSKGACSSCTSPVLVLDPTPPTINSFSSQRAFQVGAKSSQVVIVQWSTDLVNWISVSTNTIGGQPLHFTDPNPADPRKKFYRLRLWP